ncbi:AbrB/MazE/SpoVT family DNA-binding domain-containing protein [Candidatus Wolfebacteria bacterium]|nr:AbrB/MazE/SpoVT family DNA-binding domain-containing protein [Candidatus Wolfebacteria bacterium]
MTQKVLKVGSSAAVTIPKKSLKELGLKIGDWVSVVVGARSVVIRPHSNFSKSENKIAELTLNFVNRYRKDLENLSKK